MTTPDVTPRRRSDGSAQTAPLRDEAGQVPASKQAPSKAAEPVSRFETSVLFELLSDRTRRRLLTLLLDEREICVCRLAEAVDLAQPKISRHLSVLRESGVLVSRRQGTLILYRFNPALAGWAVRVISMMSEGARLEPYHDEDRMRLAQAKLRGVRPGAR
jgi:ArsR family transcriptional regulator